MFRINTFQLSRAISVLQYFQPVKLEQKKMKFLSCGLLLVSYFYLDCYGILKFFLDDFQAILACHLQEVCLSDVCTKWGYACRDNRTVVWCSMQDSRWIETEFLQCGVSFTCDEQNGMCIPAYIVGPRFDCQGEGIFPDPYQCGTYYVCYYTDGRMNKVFARCPKGKYYSVLTNTCSFEEHKFQPSCPRQFTCDYPGQVGIWPRNSNIYYVCALNPDTRNSFLFPKVFRCSENMVFNGTQCVERPQEGCALDTRLNVTDN